MAKSAIKTKLYDRNVFINCPFDKEYIPFLKIILFTILRLGLLPRLALERSNVAEGRFKKIVELIEESKYGIHDLSRLQAKKKKEYYRLNMPFELGYDFACRAYLKGRSGKKILILETEKYSIHRALSDLLFVDPRCHRGDERELVYTLRDWFNENGHRVKDSGGQVWDDYNIFYTYLFEKKQKEGWKQEDLKRITVKDYMLEVQNYLG